MNTHQTSEHDAKKPTRSSPEGPTARQSQHLSEDPTSKTKSSTHLGITIRWSVPRLSYLPVATGGGVARCPAGRSVHRCAVGPAAARRGGGVPC
jgi:hypothetical protein